MIYRHVFRGLLAGVAFLAASGAAQACAGPCGGSPCGNPCVESCAPAAPVAPVTRTITVYERVPEYYETTRTTYKSVCVTENYTAYRTECVPEVRTCTKTIIRKVPEWRDCVKTCYRWESCWETRTTYKKVHTCKEVCTVKRKWVDQGHYECQCVPARHGLFSHKKGCGDDCCEPCPPMKMKKVWVPCKVCIETPCVKKVRCTECIPCTTQVCVKKKVPYQTVTKVCTYRCIPETVCHNVTVMVSRCVPYQATRTVTKCVPVCEKVTCCRMVCKPVTRQITCYPCPPVDCCNQHRGGCCH
jgi:hypothetical protein